MIKLLGLPIAEKVKESLITSPKPSGKLAVVQIGDNPVSSLYVKKKREFAEEVGIDCVVVNVGVDEAAAKVRELGEDEEIKGIIIQLPIPNRLDREELLNLIPKEKDVDGFSYILNRDYVTIPPTVLAIMAVFGFYNIPVSRGVLIVGEGFLVGSPLKRFLAEHNIPVKVLGKGDSEYAAMLKSHEVVVVATGGGKFFEQSEFKPGAYVIDASTVQDENKIRGDVSKEGNLINLCPVPGGVGPITVAMLFKNFFSL